MYEGKIIDVRCRPCTEVMKTQFRALDQLLQKPYKIGGSLPEWYAQSMEEFVKEMKNLKMTGVIVGRWRQLGLPEVPNEHIKEIIDQYPGLFIPIGCIDPHNPKEAEKEIVKLAEWGFKGINFSMGCPGDLDPADPRLYPIYKQMSDLKLVFYIVTSPLWTTTPFSFDRVAADFPALHLLLAHGGYPMIDELITLVWRRSNVWYSPDCYQFSPGAQRYVEATNYSAERSKYVAYPLHFHGLQDRYCFGSAIPYSSPLTVRVKETLDLPWHKEVLPKIFYENAAKCFRL